MLFLCIKIKLITHYDNGDNMNELWMILYKGILSIIVLFIFTKLMGRKQVGQLNMFDYIIGITIGSIASEMTMAKGINFLEGTLGIALYALAAFLISEWTMRSIKARRFFIGTPCMIIQEGKILEKSLKKTKIDINDLLQQSRNQGYFDISEINYAIMEANGRISFLPKSKYQPLTPKDMKLNTPENGVCANLVIDGKIMNKHLKYIEKDQKWLEKRLKNLGYDNINDLLLVTYDNKEKLTVYGRNIELLEEEPFE